MHHDWRKKCLFMLPHSSSSLLTDSLEEADSLMSKLFTSTWANFVKEVIIVVAQIKMTGETPEVRSDKREPG